MIFFGGPHLYCRGMEDDRDGCLFSFSFLLLINGFPFLLDHKFFLFVSVPLCFGSSLSLLFFVFAVHLFCSIFIFNTPQRGRDNSQLHTRLRYLFSLQRRHVDWFGCCSRVGAGCYVFKVLHPLYDHKQRHSIDYMSNNFLLRDSKA